MVLKNLNYYWPINGVNQFWVKTQDHKKKCEILYISKMCHPVSLAVRTFRNMKIQSNQLRDQIVSTRKLSDILGIGIYNLPWLQVSNNLCSVKFSLAKNNRIWISFRPNQEMSGNVLVVTCSKTFFSSIIGIISNNLNAFWALIESENKINSLLGRNDKKRPAQILFIFVAV